MNTGLDFSSRVAIDLVVVSAVGGIITWPWLGAGIGWSFAAGCLWTALNLLLLSWLLEAIVQRAKVSKLFILVMACAKIPASYFVLFRLYTVGYLDVTGLTAGIVILPVTLIFRGLRHGPREQIAEEG